MTITINQCHDFGLAADVALYDANTATGRERNMVRLYAYASLDRYHGMIEAMGRRYSPELWNAVNPLDKRRCQP